MRGDPELIDVRPDEHLNLTRLDPWLRSQLPDTNGLLRVQQFGGGHANLTYLLEFDDSEYVLRRPPLGPVAPTSHDMAREHRVLTRLGTAFPLAPTSFALCQDRSILGADFHVLERRRGFVIRTSLPARLAGDIVRVRHLSEMLVDTLADLHRVSPDEVGLSDLGQPDGFVTRQLEGWSKRWAAAKNRELDRVDSLIRWLRDNIPPTQATTLLHNDYKLDNVLINPTEPTKATAVLDWDMCTRGDPLVDLGYLLNVWVESTDAPRWREAMVMPSNTPGFLTRSEVIDRYARRTGFDVDHIRWYHAFGVFKLLVILQQIYARFLRNQTADRRFANLGKQVVALAEKGVAVISDR